MSLVSRLVIGLVLTAQAALAASLPQESDLPLDMLEFLGTWQTPDGKDVNPFELDDPMDVPPADIRPRTPPADSSRKETQDKTGRKSSRQQDRLPEAPNR